MILDIKICCTIIKVAMCCRDKLEQPMPVSAAANETFKAALAKGKGEEDFSAVYEAVITKPKDD